MKAIDIIDLIIKRHEDDSDLPIKIHDSLRLDPVLNYNGKMARKAYQTYRRNWHKDRKYCGVLDFKIMDTTGKMEHSQLLARSIGIVPIQAIRKIYNGACPYTLGLTDKQLALACDVQCSFIEQEVNWGVHEFQLRTHFGYPWRENNLRNAVPRDFFMLFFERCDYEMKKGSTIKEALKIIIPQYQESYVANKMVLMPPTTGSGDRLKLQSDWLPFLRSLNMGGAKPWITPFVNRINIFCNSKGNNPNW